MCCTYPTLRVAYTRCTQVHTSVAHALRVAHALHCVLHARDAHKCTHLHTTHNCTPNFTHKCTQLRVARTRCTQVHTSAHYTQLHTQLHTTACCTHTMHTRPRQAGSLEALAADAVKLKEAVTFGSAAGNGILLARCCWCFAVKMLIDLTYFMPWNG